MTQPQNRCVWCGRPSTRGTVKTPNRSKRRFFCKPCRAAIPEGFNKCTTCGRIFEAIYATRSAGEHRCKECNAKRAGATIRNPQRRFAICKTLAKKRGLAWSLARDEYLALIANPCTYCGFELRQTGIGLDRVDSLQGYVQGNVVPCCWECNQTKNAYFTFEEMKIMGAAVAAVKAQRVKDGKPLHESNSKHGGWGRPKKYADPA